jgi:hypothetical protein
MNAPFLISPACVGWTSLSRNIYFLSINDAFHASTVLNSSNRGEDMRQTILQRVSPINRTVQWCTLFAFTVCTPVILAQDVFSHATLKNSLVCWYGFNGDFKDSHGSLDDIAVWTRELTADEIAALYADGKGMIYKASTGTIITGEARKAHSATYALPDHLLQTGPIVRAMMYGVNGRLVKELPITGHSIRWDGTSDSRNAQGVYAVAYESACGSRGIWKVVLP